MNFKRIHERKREVVILIKSGNHYMYLHIFFVDLQKLKFGNPAPLVCWPMCVDYLK